MKPNCTITLLRQGERPQTFEGTILKESSSHYLVKHDKNDPDGIGAEWFPKASRSVNCLKWATEQEH